MQQALESLGIVTIGDLARFEPENLRVQFGIHGVHLHALANGIDDRDVESNDEVKSISHEETFDEDTDDQREIFNTLLHLSEKVSSRLRAHDLKGRNLTLKVRLSGFHTYSHSVRFDERTNHADKIFRRAKELFIDHFSFEGAVRLIGVRMAQFDDGYVQDSLFTNDQDDRNEAVHQAVDHIRDRFGDCSIRRAGG